MTLREQLDAYEVANKTLENLRLDQRLAERSGDAAAMDTATAAYNEFICGEWTRAYDAVKVKVTEIALANGVTVAELRRFT